MKAVKEVVSLAKKNHFEVIEDKNSVTVLGKRIVGDNLKTILRSLQEAIEDVAYTEKADQLGLLYYTVLDLLDAPARG